MAGVILVETSTGQPLAAPYYVSFLLAGAVRRRARCGIQCEQHTCMHACSQAALRHCMVVNSPVTPSLDYAACWHLGTLGLVLSGDRIPGLL